LFEETEAIYSITLSDNSPLPSFASFNSLTREFSIYTADSSLIGEYEFLIKMELDSNFVHDTQTFIVTIEKAINFKPEWEALTEDTASIL